MPQSIHKTPEEVAQALIDSFNARDIEGVLKTYSSDSIGSNLPSGEVFIAGHAKIRNKFNTIFNQNPKLKIEVVNRIVDGKFVIDKEMITELSEGKEHVRYSTVIYEITEGLIRKEWYLRK